MRKTISSLEGLRGVAALFVVIYHMQFSIPGLGAAKSGYLAVDLFFVLSGFVINCAYGSRLCTARDWLVFMLRRFGRLWPVHIAASVVCYVTWNVVPALVMLAHTSAVKFVIPGAKELLGVVLMVQGLNTFDRDIGNGNSWSASDEFYVYLLFGLLCLTLRGRARVAAFTVLALIGYGLAVWVSIGAHCFARGTCYDMTYSYGWLRCLAGFFAGALVAEFRDTKAIAALVGRVPQTLAFSSTLAFFLCANLVPGAAFAAPVVFVALIAALSRDSGPTSRIFQTGAAQYLGRLSYSLYLVHGAIRPLLVIMAKVTTGTEALVVEGGVFLLASFVLAHALHRFIEVPFRRRFYAWSDTAFQAPAATRVQVE